MRGHYIQTRHIRPEMLIEIVDLTTARRLRQRNWHALYVSRATAQRTNVEGQGIYGFGGRWYHELGSSATGCARYGKVHVFNNQQHHRVIGYIPLSNRYALRRRT